MRGCVYVESTIPSYLVSRPSRDVVVCARQQVTREWWETWRESFDLVVSQVVIDEVAEGDAEMAAARLSVIGEIPLLDINDEVIELASKIISCSALPPKASRDAAHVAVAAVHGVKYLLTWNCTHLANAQLFDGLQGVCSAAGHRCPIICTPDELGGG